MNRKISLTMGLAFAMVLLPQFATAGSLENMERERARLIATYLNMDMDVQNRLEQITRIQNRLVDMERMVLRDKSLTDATSPDVQLAFQNYDLTFLVHASVEKDVSILDLWLDQLGLNSNEVLSADMGRK